MPTRYGLQQQQRQINAVFAAATIELVAVTVLQRNWFSLHELAVFTGGTLASLAAAAFVASYARKENYSTAAESSSTPSASSRFLRRKKLRPDRYAAANDLDALAAVGDFSRDDDVGDVRLGTEERASSHEAGGGDTVWLIMSSCAVLLLNLLVQFLEETMHDPSSLASAEREWRWLGESPAENLVYGVIGAKFAYSILRQVRHSRGTARHYSRGKQAEVRFDEVYALGKELGSGYFATVCLARLLKKESRGDEREGTTRTTQTTQGEESLFAVKIVKKVKGIENAEEEGEQAEYDNGFSTRKKIDIDKAVLTKERRQGNNNGEPLLARAGNGADDDDDLLGEEEAERRRRRARKDAIYAEEQIKSQRARVATEVNILRIVRKHENVLRIERFFEEPSSFYIVTEYCRGGELFARIVKLRKFYESQAKRVVWTIADALRHCHERGIVHRDLKPENILMENEGEDSRIKLADFGLSRIVPKEGCTTACGTPQYVAPEMISGVTYGVGVDVWSLGVVAYILLCGFPPFADVKRRFLFAKIRRGLLDFPSPYWDFISFSAKDFVRRCLTVNPAKRLTIEGVLEHSWLIGPNGSQRAISPPKRLISAPRSSEVRNGKDVEISLNELKKFNARRKLKVIVLAAKATAKMNYIGKSSRRLLVPIPSDENS